MNSTVGLQYTLHSVMVNAPAESEMAALQMMHSDYIPLVRPLDALGNFMGLSERELYVLLIQAVNLHCFLST